GCNLVLFFVHKRSYEEQLSNLFQARRSFPEFLQHRPKLPVELGWLLEHWIVSHFLDKHRPLVSVLAIGLRHCWIVKRISTSGIDASHRDLGLPQKRLAVELACHSAFR